MLYRNCDNLLSEGIAKILKRILLKLALTVISVILESGITETVTIYLAKCANSKTDFTQVMFVVISVLLGSDFTETVTYF